MWAKIKKALQWCAAGCFILSGLVYLGEYTALAVALMVLAGVLLLPPVTKRIPAFKGKKIVLIAASLVMLTVGMNVGETNLSPEVLAKREAAAASAASSKAEAESRQAAESASRAAAEAEKAASKEAQEKEKAEAAAASRQAEEKAKSEKAVSEAKQLAREKEDAQNAAIKEYKSLIESTLKSSPNYANTESSNKKAFKKISGDDLELFTAAWRQYLKTHFENSRVSGGITKSDTTFFNHMVELYEYFFEDQVQNQIPEEYEMYRTHEKDWTTYKELFNKTYKGFLEPTEELYEGSVWTFNVIQKMEIDYNSTLDRVYAKANGNDKYDNWECTRYVDAQGGYWEYFVVRTDGTIKFPRAGEYELVLINSGRTLTCYSEKGFEQEQELYYGYDPDEYFSSEEKLEEAFDKYENFGDEVYEMTRAASYGAL